MSEQPRYGKGDATYKAAGEYPGILKLVQRFYYYMDSLPEAAGIRALHAPDLSVSEDKLARFLCGWTGGPTLYREKYGPIRIPAAHKHLPIGTVERDAWLLCMERALQDQDYPQDLKDYLLKQLEVPAEFCRNRD